MQMPDLPSIDRVVPDGYAVMGPDRSWSADATQPNSGGGLSLADALGVLRRHVLLILTVSAATLAGTAFLLSREVAHYQAGALVRLRDHAAALAGALATTKQPTGGGGPRSDPLAAEIMVLQGPGVAAKVVDRAGLRLFSPAEGRVPAGVRDVEVSLAADASLPIALRFTPGGVVARAAGHEVRALYGSPVVLAGVRFTVAERPAVDEASWQVLPRESMVGLVRAGLQAQPREGLAVMDVFYSSPDPELATRVVNLAVEAYQEVNAETAREQAARRRQFLAEQLRENDSLFMVAQAALSEFRSRAKAYSTREKFAAQQQKLLEVEARRQELDSERRLYQAMLGQAGGRRGAGMDSSLLAVAALPGVGADGMVARRYQQLVGYTALRDSLLTIYTARNTEVQRVDTLVAATEVALQEAVRSYLSSLNTRIAALDELRNRNAGTLEGLFATESGETRLVQQVEILRSVGDQLRGEYQRARIAEAVETGQVEIVSRAPGAIPVESNRAQKYMLGLLLGLMLGSGGAFLLEARNTSIRRRDDLRQVLHVPQLAIIPPMTERPRGLLKRRSGHAEPAGGAAVATVLDAVTAEFANSPGAEAYRTLRNNLLCADVSGTLKTLVVTSATAQEGKTTTVARLGTVLAQQGKRVLLVSCDFRRPGLEALLKVPREPGLTDVLLQRTSPMEAIRDTGVEGVSILPCGSPLHLSFELLSGQRLTTALEWLAESYDLIIIDSPPLLGASEAAILAARADAVLLVVRAGQTPREALQLAAEQLNLVGARVIGSVLNDPDAELGGVKKYYGYYAAYTAQS